MSGPGEGKGSEHRPYSIFTMLAISAVLALELVGIAFAAPTRRPTESKSGEIRSYVIGYGAALALTGAAFADVHWQSFEATTTFAIVLVLALVQMVVHFRFFLHISFGKSSRDDLQVILFSSLIILLMVSGTLVILFNLRERMM
jgi:cytochrome o ubiquinol oxidase operon protein cyoD